MMKYIFFFLSLLFHANFALAQQSDTYMSRFLDYFNKKEGKTDIVNLENRISKLTKKMPQLKKEKGIRQFNLLECYLDTPFLARKDYIDHSFLGKVRYGHYHLSRKSILSKKRYYMRTQTLVTDSSGHLLAKGDARHLYKVFSSPIDENEKKLAKILFNENYDFVFYLVNNLFEIYFCIKNNHIDVLQWSEDSYSHLPWEEYVNMFWERNNHGYIKGIIDGSSFSLDDYKKNQ